MGWLALLAAIVVGVPAAMYFAQDSLLFFPQPLAGPPRNTRPVEPLKFEREAGVTLRGWLLRGRIEPAPLVLYYGGNAEELSWQLSEPWPADWSVALVNYRGYGESGGRPSEASLFADALAVHDVLARRPDVDASRIVVVGHSLGSGVATYVAAERPVAAVALVSPYDSMTELAGRHYPWLPVRLLLKHPFDSISRAPRIHAPLLAIAAGRDRVIPVVHTRRLVEAWAGSAQLVEIAEADHNDISARPQYWPALNAFFGQVMRQ